MREIIPIDGISFPTYPSHYQKRRDYKANNKWEDDEEQKGRCKKEFFLLAACFF